MTDAYRGTNGPDIINQKELGLEDWTNIYGLDGDDTIYIENAAALGGRGNDSIVGLGVFSTVAYNDCSAGIVVDLNLGTVLDGYGGCDTLSNIYTIQGSGWGDTIYGSNKKDSFWSFGNSDFFDGKEGIDTLRISITNSNAVPAITKTTNDFTISYASNSNQNLIITASNIEILQIYRGGANFDTWDLTGSQPYKLEDGAISDQLTGPISTFETWQPSNFGIVQKYITEDVGAWYYPTASDYHAPGNLSIDAHNATMGDFNGDGYQDIVINWVLFPHVIPHNTQLAPTVLYGSANGLIEPVDNNSPSSLARHQNYRIVTANLNGDGIDDFVFGAMHHPIYADLNRSTITWVADPTAAAIGTQAGLIHDISDRLSGQTLDTGIANSSFDFDHSTASGDLNKDGIDDIFSGNNIWISDGTGRWSESSSKVSALLPALSPMSLAIGDLNNDQTKDIVALYPNFSDDRVLLFNDTNGNLSFSKYILPAGLYGANTKDNFVIIADINYDGLNDIVVSETRAIPYYIGSAIQILIQKRPGIFVDETALRIDNSIRDQVPGEGQLFFMDMNGDGFGDIVHSGDGDGIAIFINDGGGKFDYYDINKINFIPQTKIKNQITSADSATQINLPRAYPIDINHDGIMDLVVQAIAPDYSNPWSANANISLELYTVTSTGNEFGRNMNEILAGSNFSDKIYGLGGNDTINGGAGNDTIIGGNGTDTAIFAAASRTLETRYSPAAFTVRGSASTIGTDTLTNIENIQLSDATIETAWFSKTDALTNSQSDSLVELYIASFNRAPDTIGLNYWGGRLYDGMTLPEIAKSFFVQPETVAAYPASMATRTFVTTVYNNVLSRAPDTEGLNYWVREIDTGSVTKDVFLLAIINGAKASSGSAVDRQTLANKVSVGNYFAFDKGINNTTWGIDVMDSVTSATSTVTAANALTDTYSAAIATGTSSSSAMLLGVSDNDLAAGLL